MCGNLGCTLAPRQATHPRLHRPSWVAPPPTGPHGSLRATQLPWTWPADRRSTRAINKPATKPPQTAVRCPTILSDLLLFQHWRCWLHLAYREPQRNGPTPPPGVRSAVAAPGVCRAPLIGTALSGPDDQEFALQVLPVRWPPGWLPGTTRPRPETTQPTRPRAFPEIWPSPEERRL